MLQMSMLDFLVLAIPDGLIYILALYVISKTPIDRKKYWLASGTHALMIFGIRYLPISYGVHTILIMTVLILIGINIIKLDAISVIKATIMTVILQFISEGIVAFTLEKVMTQGISELVSYSKIRILCGLASLLILLSIILIIRRRYERSVQYGKNGEQTS